MMMTVSLSRRDRDDRCAHEHTVGKLRAGAWYTLSVSAINSIGTSSAGSTTILSGVVTVRQARGAAAALLVAVLAACSAPSPEPVVSPSAAPAEVLTIVHDDGDEVTTWQLSCDPPAGTHPDPAAACAVLADRGPAALAPAEPGRMCTQEYGGPDTATVTGRWQGREVDTTFGLRNGCEIARWRALVGVLPPLPR